MEAPPQENPDDAGWTTVTYKKGRKVHHRVPYLQSIQLRTLGHANTSTELLGKKPPPDFDISGKYVRHEVGRSRESIQLR